MRTVYELISTKSNQVFILHVKRGLKLCVNTQTSFAMYFVILNIHKRAKNEGSDRMDAQSVLSFSCSHLH